LTFDSVALLSANISGVSLGADTTASGLSSGSLSFTSDSFTVNFAGVTAACGDVISLVASVSGGAVGAVPLPASAPIFSAALIVLGAVGYGIKRNAKAAA
jgi:hypothetical protein